ncbi:MucR family transcriptional regulator [Mesorhizobium sp. SB112]|uniref:MucR family transcriptional regulator n=1 Tax=Mesorhizobium sp. SB112 TaxID=3151853 RepID=UPI0032678992
MANELLNLKSDTQIELTAEIVSAYVSNNPVPAAEVANLIASVHASIASLSKEPEPETEPQKPAVSVKKSISDDYLICLEDGKRFKSLKRHLMTHYGLTPDAYRGKWGLPKDYPMVAPSYAAARSQLAKNMGLGRRAGETVTKVPSKAAATRGRARKSA